MSFTPELVAELEVLALFDLESTLEGLKIHQTADPLDKDTHTTYDKTDKGGFFIAILRDKHTGGNTHYEVSDEVTIVTNLCKHI